MTYNDTVHYPVKKKRDLWAYLQGHPRLLYTILFLGFPILTTAAVFITAFFITLPAAWILGWI